jgi:tetratricopeptide (TPR) repeat protein
MRVIVGMVLAALPALADWSANYRLGEAFLEQGRTEDAVRELKIALKENPEEVTILDALGRAELRAGRYRSAKGYFEKASHHAAVDNAIPLANWAQVCFVLGEYSSAEQLLRRTLAMLPESADAWHLLGQVFYKSRRYADADSAFHKALALSHNALIWSDLAAIYLSQHQEEQGMQMFRRAISEGSAGQGRARVRANLAQLQWKRGENEAARTGFQEALDEMTIAVGSSHPEIAVILERYSQVLRKSGQKAEAKGAAARAAEIRSVFDLQSNRNGFTVDWSDVAGGGPRRR